MIRKELVDLIRGAFGPAELAVGLVLVGFVLLLAIAVAVTIAVALQRIPIQ